MTEPAAQPDDLTVEEARSLADELGLDLYRAQDALAFVAECCDIADREGRQPTTADVREWLKGARCGRQLAVDAQAEAAAVTEPDLARLHRLRGQLAAEHAKAVVADQQPRPDIRVSPHSGIAAGLEIALHYADGHLQQADGSHDSGPTVHEAKADDRRWPLEKAGE